MKACKIYQIPIIVAMFIIGGNAWCGGLSHYIKEFNERAINTKDKIINEILLYETHESFYNTVDFIKSYMEDTRDLVNREFISDRRWASELKAGGFIHGAYIEIENVNYTVGDTFSPKLSSTDTFYIDNDGFIHYVYANEEYSIAADIILAMSSLEESSKDFQRIPLAIFFYDKKSDKYSSLLGDVDDFPEKTVKKMRELNLFTAFIGMRKILLMKELSLKNSEMVLFSLYSYKFGRKTILLFGLIAIIILTILLLWFVIDNIFKSSKQMKEEVFGMGEEEKAGDIIREIDKEVSGIVEEKEELIQKKEVEPEKIEVDDTIKKLEDDGIYVRK